MSQERQDGLWSFIILLTLIKPLPVGQQGLCQFTIHDPMIQDSMMHHLCLNYANMLFGPHLDQKGPMKQHLSICLSFLPSFRPSASFLGIGSLVFSKTQHDVSGPYIVVCDSWIFQKKSPLGKNDQITSLVLSGICVK